MKKNNKNALPALAVLAIILEAVACLLAVYLHLPAQRYKSALTLGKKYLNEMNFDENGSTLTEEALANGPGGAENPDVKSAGELLGVDDSQLVDLY
ncbi:MAG: hypothetical protein ACI4D6_05240 [Chordicoccus sp.]